MFFFAKDAYTHPNNKGCHGKRGGVSHTQTSVYNIIICTPWCRLPPVSDCGVIIHVEKRVNFAQWPILVFNRAYLQGCDSYSLETRYGDPSIIALCSLKISRLAHFQCGRGDREYCRRSKNGRFMPHFGGPPVTISGKNIATLSNVVSWGAYKLSLWLLVPLSGGSLKYDKI